MFGRIRASASSLDTLEGSPSKILKDDSFSIYEATLMKLKIGAKRDAYCNQTEEEEEEEEVITDCSVSSPRTEEANNMDADCTLAASASCSPGDEITLMDTDSSSITTAMTSPSFSDGGKLEQRGHSNASILHFFKIKDPGHDTVSTKNGSSGSVSSSAGSVESNCTSETESAPNFRDCEMSE